MKKVALLVMLSVVLLLSACSGNGGGGGSKNLDTGGEKPPQDKGGQKTVVISVMMKDRFLEAAARKFEEQHKDIHIEIKEYRAAQPAGEGSMSMEAISLADVEKYVQSVTTQVISGKGSDLMLMSELPQDKFVAKKLLVNLNDLMAGDSSFDRNTLYSNILKASQDGEGLYAMPLSFSLSLFQGNTELLKKANISVGDNESWNWNQFKEIAQKLKQQGDSDKAINLDPTGLLFDFVEDNYAQLAGQGQPNFDSDLFRNLITEIKSMFDEGLLSEGFSFDSSKAAFQMVDIYSPEQALTMPQGMDYYEKPSASGQKDGAPFKPAYSLGINSKSDVQQEAWAFVKFLLSDEMQASPNLMGLPMNKGATSNKLKEVLQKIETGTLETMIPANMLPDGETVKKRIEAVEKQISKADYRRTSDMKVLMIAMEEFKSFMSGQKSAEEVSKLIQNRVKTYLNE
ncbi:ABC transporter substrate-binding protein [Paenibacillus radicis (ex Gao et al. 2016)]|uniref:ABC transporter substrate-binding protein n=1 Tax=Paenibacillus radicis (ex Gao et al. 2016) TaxID=1737354 RepID=A0A917LR42_9BACL|nr:extracellular solute-binding protein [Paenibacillus radicis (ex Gao et al. 2016)]GGG52126.1 ABC transporter substrate-binding protein [Paenibacillus radicis (ex Gao et al. 2016)]